MQYNVAEDLRNLEQRISAAIDAGKEKETIQLDLADAFRVVGVIELLAQELAADAAQSKDDPDGAGVPRPTK